jgi:cytochrome P450
MVNIVVKWSQLITPIHLTLVLVLVFLVTIFHNFVTNSHYTKLKRAQGPFPLWPFLGNLPLLHKLPHRDFYNLSKTYGDIMELKLGSMHTIIISSARLAKEIFKTHDQAFSFRPLPTTLRYFTYGGLSVGWTHKTDDYWQRLRKMEVLELFSPKSLIASKHVRDEEISSLMHDVFEDCKEGKPTNMRTRLFDTSMNMMTRVLFGKRYFGLKLSNKKNDEFKDVILKQLAIAGNFNIGDFVPLLRPFDFQGIITQSKQLRLKVDQIFDEMIQDRLKQNGLNDSKDFLSAMLSLPKTHGFGDRLGDNTIKAVLNVSYDALAMYLMISSKELNVFQ